MTPADKPPILVVDDNPDNAEIIRQYLEIRGYPTTVAHSGDEALALFETIRPAVVLLDVMMPGRDGWEVCRVMKQHPTLGRSVRVVMVTALTVTLAFASGGLLQSSTSVNGSAQSSRSAAFAQNASRSASASS